MANPYYLYPDEVDRKTKRLNMSVEVQDAHTIVLTSVLPMEAFDEDLHAIQNLLLPVWRRMWERRRDADQRQRFQKLYPFHAADSADWDSWAEKEKADGRNPSIGKWRRDQKARGFKV